MKKHEEESGGFAISTYDERLVEDNARERFGPKYGDKEDRAEMMEAGLVDAKGAITPKGWDVLNEDIGRLESNSLAWLRKRFKNARDEGHGGRNGEELIGTFWFDPDDPEQARLISLGVDERIDMNESSYVALADYAWKGVSRFGAAVLGGQINFFGIDKDVLEEIEDTIDEARRAGRR